MLVFRVATERRLEPGGNPPFSLHAAARRDLQALAADLDSRAHLSA